MTAKEHFLRIEDKQLREVLLSNLEKYDKGWKNNYSIPTDALVQFNWELTEQGEEVWHQCWNRLTFQPYYDKYGKSEQTPMMQLRGNIIFRLQIIEKTLPGDLRRELRRNLQSILDDIDGVYIPIEQQAFEDAFDVGIKEEYEHNAYGAAYTYEDGRDYYNQTYKS